MAMKNGGKVMLHAMAQDTEDDVQPGRPDEKDTPKRARPMSLERTFHVTHISPMKEKASGNTSDMADAVGYLKKQQGQKMAKSGGRDVT
jgi:hypothetical protein